MPLPSVHNFTKGNAHWQGDSFNESVTLNSVDLTGGTAKFTIKSNKADTTNIYQKTYSVLGTDFTVTSGNTFLNLFIPDEDDAGYPAELLANATYFYDLELAFADDTKRTYLTGKISIKSDVT